MIICDLIHYYNNTEIKGESANKKELLKGDFNLMFEIKKSLSKYARLLDTKGEFRPLYVQFNLNILTALLCERKESTSPEETWYIVG